MATCLKRSSKPPELSRAGRVLDGGGATGASAAEPSLRELICPVCRSILREPVSLPCAHNLCLRCLRGTVEHNSLTCPLCRQRLGSWLRARPKPESLVNAELWQLIRRRYPEELESAIAATSSSEPHDLDPEFLPKKILSAAGEIRKEYQIQLQLAEEEMRRQREKERIASETLIRKIQLEEKQQKLMQLAQDQLLAKTLAKRQAVEKSSEKRQRKATALAKAEIDESKSANNQKVSVKSKSTSDSKKQNVSMVSKIRTERYASTVQKESTEALNSQKTVPIHNAVTRVVTHQSRVSQPNNSTCSAALGELIGSNSKIYGLQIKEELHVPSDVVNSKKKKLGVEVCVSKVQGEERIGSAESAGSHDSINQEIHHFKPIKALPRTPLRATIDGRPLDPKLIRVLPILKRVSNVIPKPPTPTHTKKMFGCSWSAFKRISRQEQQLQQLEKDITPYQVQETKKTEKVTEQTKSGPKLSKPLQVLEEHTGAEVNFDSNKNYTKNSNKVVNGTKVGKKLEESKRAAKPRNGQLNAKHRPQKEIEVVELEDDEQDLSATTAAAVPHDHTPDPLAFTPKIEPRPSSPTLELAMENIAERIKRRKNTRTISNTENSQCAMNQVVPTERPIKAKSKKSTATRGRKPKAKKALIVPKVKPKIKTKMAVVTSVTSQIKRLAARSGKRPRYTEDTESEEEEEEEEEVQEETKESPQQQEQLVEPPNPSPPKFVVEPEEGPSNDDVPTSTLSPPPTKKARKVPKASRKQSRPRKNVKPMEIVDEDSVEPKVGEDVSENSDLVDEAAAIREQERLERQAAQEREDRELALKLQQQFDAMGRIAGRTRRGIAARPQSPSIDDLFADGSQRRPQKRAAIK